MRLSQGQRKLVGALRKARASNTMIDNALDGLYDDFKSSNATPQVLLMQHSKREGLSVIVRGVKRGEFDGTREDCDAWAKSPDGKKTLNRLMGFGRGSGDEDRPLKERA